MTKQLRCLLVTSLLVLSTGSVHDAASDEASPALFCPSQVQLGVAGLPVVLIFSAPIVLQSSFTFSDFLRTQGHRYLVVLCKVKLVKNESVVQTYVCIDLYLKYLI